MKLSKDMARKAVEVAVWLSELEADGGPRDRPRYVLPTELVELAAEVRDAFTQAAFDAMEVEG